MHGFLQFILYWFVIGAVVGPLTLLLEFMLIKSRGPEFVLWISTHLKEHNPTPFTFKTFVAMAGTWPIEVILLVVALYHKQTMVERQILRKKDEEERKNKVSLSFRGENLGEANLGDRVLWVPLTQEKNAFARFQRYERDFVPTHMYAILDDGSMMAWRYDSEMGALPFKVTSNGDAQEQCDWDADWNTLCQPDLVRERTAFWRQESLRQLGMLNEDSDFPG